jgi:hypothetical protein
LEDLIFGGEEGLDGGCVFHMVREEGGEFGGKGVEVANGCGFWGGVENGGEEYGGLADC